MRGVLLFFLTASFTGISLFGQCAGCTGGGGGATGFTAGAGTLTGPAVSGTVSQAPGANGIPQLDGSGNLAIWDYGARVNQQGVGYSLGGNVASGDDAAILIHRAATNPLSSGGSPPGARDESTYILWSRQRVLVIRCDPEYKRSHSLRSRAWLPSENGVEWSRRHQRTRRVCHTQLQINQDAGNVMGYKASVPLGTGAITNYYGLWIDDPTTQHHITNYALISMRREMRFRIMGGPLQIAGGLTGSYLGHFQWFRKSG